MQGDFVKAFCPKCHSQMAFAVALPHPKAAAMVKATFLCQPCNRTWTYILSTEMAERYQPAPDHHQPIEAA
jgi:transposase-like protein